MSAKNCNQCEKVFTTSSSLSHHKRTHNKLNVVTCEFCGFQFTSKNLKSLGFKIPVFRQNNFKPSRSMGHTCK